MDMIVEIQVTKLLS